MNYLQALVELGFSAEKIGKNLPSPVHQKKLYDNYQALQQIGLSEQHYSSILDKPHSAENFVDAIDALLMCHRKLRDDFGISAPEQLVQIASHKEAEKTIRWIKQYGDQLIDKMNIKNDIGILVQLASHDNATFFLERLLIDFPILRTVLQITDLNVFVTLSTCPGGSQTVKALAEFAEILKKDLNFTNEQLILMATKIQSGAAATITYLGNEVEQLKTRGISAQAIIAIPRFLTRSTHRNRLAAILNLMNANTQISPGKRGSKRKMPFPADEQRSSTVNQEVINSVTTHNMNLDDDSETELHAPMLLRNMREASTSTRLSTTTVSTEVSTIRMSNTSVSMTVASISTEVDKMDNSDLTQALIKHGFNATDINFYFSTVTQKKQMLTHFDALHAIGFRVTNFEKYLFNSRVAKAAANFIFAIPVFLTYHATLTDLKITSIKDYFTIMKQQGANNAIPALVKNKDALAAINITTPRDLVAITKPGGASLSIPALVDKNNLKILSSLGISQPAQLVKIASYDGAVNAINSLVLHGAKILEKLNITTDELLMIAAHTGGGPAVSVVAENIITLKEVLKIQKGSDVVAIAKINGGAKTIMALARHGKALMDELGFTTQQLVQMAMVTNSAGPTLDFIASKINHFKANQVTANKIVQVYKLEKSKKQHAIYLSDTTHDQRVNALNRLIPLAPYSSQRSAPSRLSGHPAALFTPKRAKTISVPSVAESVDDDNHVTQHDALVQIGFRKEDLDKIATYAGAEETFAALIDKGREIVELMEINDIADLVGIACHDNSGPGIVALATHWYTLHEILKITNYDLLLIAGTDAAEKKFTTLVEQGTNLIEELGSTPRELVNMVMVKPESAANHPATLFTVPKSSTLIYISKEALDKALSNEMNTDNTFEYCIQLNSSQADENGENVTSYEFI